MPILFALFATLRGSPFANTNLPVNLEIVPQAAIEQVEQSPLVTKPANVFVADGEHFRVGAVVHSGPKIGVGDTTKIELRSVDDKSLDDLRVEYQEEGVDITPVWNVTKGSELVEVQDDGTIKALAPGDVTIQAEVPGLAADKGFLFIEKLGRIGVTGENGEIHWDILSMIVFFGLSLYVSQQVTNGGSTAGDTGNDQQQAIAKFTPIIFSGMFLFFPLPAGVLMYMVIANIFQTAQSFILYREPMPENLQKLVDEQERKAKVKSGDRGSLAFEPGSRKTAKTVDVKATTVVKNKGENGKVADNKSGNKSGSKKKVSKKKG